MRAVAYIRRSKDPTEGNSSLADQRAWITEESRKHQHTLAQKDIFEEVVSAYRDRSRPQRNRLEEVLADGDVSALYVRDLDRLARRLMDTARIVDICNRHNVTIYTHDRVFAPRSTDTILLVSVLGGLAETEAATTSKRLKRTAESIRQRGGWNGPAPYGWILPRERNAAGVKSLVLHPDESTIVRQIVEWRLEGKSVSDIVNDLSSAGVTNRTGQPFQYRSIASMLRHPLLAGYNSVSAKVNPGTSARRPDVRDTREIVIDKDGQPVRSHEAVCTPEEWGVLRLLMKPQPLKKTRARAGGLPLVGLVYCAACGSKMTSNRSQGESGTYVCTGRLRGTGCPGVAINAGALDHFIREVVATSLDDPEVREWQSAHLRDRATESMTDELAELHAQAAAMQDSINLLQKQIRNTPAIAMAALVSRIGEEDALLNQIDQLIAGHTNGHPRVLPDLSGSEFLELSEKEKNVVTRGLIRKIVITPHDGKRGSVKGLFGSQGTNLSRIGFWFIGDDTPEPRLGSGYSLLPSDGRYRCPHCEEPRIFRYRNNLRHHMNYAHPKPVPCPECGDQYPLPGLPSHRLNKHGVKGTGKSWS